MEGVISLVSDSTCLRNVPMTGTKNKVPFRNVPMTGTKIKVSLFCVKVSLFCVKVSLFCVKVSLLLNNLILLQNKLTLSWNILPQLPPFESVGVVLLRGFLLRQACGWAGRGSFLGASGAPGATAFPYYVDVFRLSSEVSCGRRGLRRSHR